MKKKEIKYILITLGCLFKNISLGLIPIVLISFYSCNSDPILENNKIIETSEPYLALGYVELPYGNDNLLSELDRGDRFGRDHDKIGDVDGDGVIDLVVGARSDDDGEIDAGAVYILFMNHDGSLKSHQKISMISGGFSDVLNEGNFFGYGVAGIGDYNYDGIPDIAVSSPVPPNNEDGVSHYASSGFFGSYVDLEGVYRTEFELIKRYREMSLHPEVDSAIEDIVNEAIVSDTNDTPIQIDLDNLNASDGIKKKIRSEFKYILDLLDFDKKSHEIYRNWYVDGRLFYHKIIDLKNPQEGIKELRYIDASKMRYVRQQKKKPGDKLSTIQRITTDNPMDYEFPELEEYFIYNPRSIYP